ncbi:hypothetical protein [Anaeroselena agilis]|uniref:Uncharacterized protein n=1 Tax=Anaeroselena agilis TaxID=3063788 RepID=A0ABU3NWD5_9FIRM|nr:hypothetical protein [Selenomonadales bacterium 4137-cl]MDT8901867.1 hypothetical protein [Selenomonadales bacterium 4137-cl]
MASRSVVKPIPELNMSKVIAALRGHQVGLYSGDDGINLVTNTQIMLVLSDDELWHVQASLRLREVNGWYYPGNQRPHKDFPESARGIIASAINAQNVTLELTGLTEHNDKAYLARDGGYVLIDQKYIDIFNVIKTAEQQADNPNSTVLINGKHLICPIVGIVSKYLLPLQARQREAV